MITKEHQKALDKTKVELFLRPDSTFIVTVCYGLKHEFDPSIPTAATNGKTVKYNPDFFMSLNQKERLGLMLHETWHVVFDHVGEISRRQNRCPIKWNIAGDHVINLMLLKSGVTLPEGALADTRYKGMSTEQIYDLLPDDVPPPKINDLLPCDGDPEKFKAELEDLLSQATVKANMAGEGIGSLPGEIQQALEKLLAPKLNWKNILSQYFTSMAKTDYSFRRPNRRYLPKHIIPSAYSEALGDVVVAVDASGSITDDEITRIITEASGIIRSTKLKKLRLLQFDTSIHSIDEINNLSDIKKITIKGRGGTCLRETMDWLKENKPDVCVIFTDGEFHQDYVDPKLPIIWLVHSQQEFSPKFGKVIHYEP